MAVFECAYVDEYLVGARGRGYEAVGFLFIPVRYLSQDGHGGFGPIFLWVFVYMESPRDASLTTGLKVVAIPAF